MKNLKQLTLIFILVIFLILSFSNISNASSSNLLLNNLDFIAQINEDGSMTVTENWDINIEDTNTLYKTFKTDKSKYSSIENVEVKDVTNGANKSLLKSNYWAYHMSKGQYFGGMNSDGKFEIAWGVGLEDKRETRKYEIKYVVKDAIAKYSDYAELYWQFIGQDFEVSAKNVTGTIYLPSNANSKEEIKVWGHTQDLNGEIYATDTNKIEFTMNGFNTGRYLEVRALFPTQMITSSARGTNKDILDSVISEETVWANEANQRRKNKETMNLFVTIIVFAICIVIGVILIKKFIKTLKELKTMKKFKPTQELQYFRDIPDENSTPAQSLYLHNRSNADFGSTQLGEIFSATLLDLSLKKVLEFEITKNEKGKEKIIIRILKQNDENLSEDETAIFNFLKQACKESNEITSKDLEKYIKRSSTKIIELQKKIQKSTEEIIAQKELIDLEEKKKYTKSATATAGYVFLIFGAVFLFSMFSTLIGVYAIFIALLIVILSIMNIVVCSMKTSRINVFTQKGVDESEKWRGLKKFMNEFSMLDKREIPELVLWEKYLVYATAFGIADKVLEQLKIVYPNINETINVGTYTYMYMLMNTNFATSFSNSISTSISSTYSSATGGGGGFSGRRWRRPEAGGGGGGR